MYEETCNGNPEVKTVLLLYRESNVDAAGNEDLCKQFRVVSHLIFFSSYDVVIELRPVIHSCSIKRMHEEKPLAL
jgi:hypothetical protein